MSKMMRLSSVALLVVAQIELVSQTKLAGLTPQRWDEDLSALVSELARKHADLYHTMRADQFESAVSTLRQRIPTLSWHQHVTELARIVAMVNDGHTELQLLQPATGFRVIPVVFYRFAEGLFITAAAPELKDIVGAQVFRIGSLDVDEATARVLPLLSRDNDVEYLHSAPAYLGCTEVLHALGITETVDAVPLDILARSGERRTLSVPAVTIADRPPLIPLHDVAGVPPPLAMSRPGVYYWFESLPALRAVYFQYNASANQQGREPVAQVTRDLFRAIDAAKARRLIIDVRNNNGGNVDRNRDIVRNIAERPTLQSQGSLFVITGRRTFSAGLSLVVDLQKIAQPIIVGEASRGLPSRPGNRETLTLPHSHLVVDYSQRIDSEQFRSARSRILPVDITTPPDFASAVAGRDPAFEAIAALIRKSAQ